MHIKHVCGFTTLAALLATSAFADPILIGSGAGQLRGRDTVHEGIGFISMRGVGLSLEPLFFHFEVNLPCDSDGPVRCAAGDEVSLSGPARAEFSPAGRINGVPVSFVFASLNFTVEPVTVPAKGSVSTPFTLTGHLRGVEFGGVVTTEADIVGRGTLQALFEPDSSLGPGIFLNDLSYAFDAAAPIPEPTTISLLVFAAASAAVQRRNTRRRL